MPALAHLWRAGRDGRPTTRRRTPTRFLRGLALLALLSLAGCVTGPRAPQPVDAADRPTHNLQIYDEVWHRVETNYYDETFHGLDWHAAGERHRDAARAAADDDRLYAAINDLLAELKDGHTHAASPRAVAARLQTQRVVVGLLLRPDPESMDRQLVIGTMPGSSAAENGVQPGWVLVTCDAKKPRDVLGPGRLTDGQKIACEFLDHDNGSHAITLTARKLSTAPLRLARTLADGVVYLRFDEFDKPGARWLREQLKQHADAPGFIIDLRANPGGDAFVLMRALGEFFPSPVRVGTFVARRGLRFPIYSWWWFGMARTRAPVAVLVSENSASSSEIFAYAMQVHQRAVIVGSKTAGVVLGSRFGRLRDGGRLQLSMQDFRALDESPLEGRGVSPDIGARRTLDDLRAGRDPVIDAALEALRAGAAPARN